MRLRASKIEGLWPCFPGLGASPSLREQGGGFALPISGKKLENRVTYV